MSTRAHQQKMRASAEARKEAETAQQLRFCTASGCNGAAYEAIKSAVFTLETVAHLQGQERNLLPLCEKLRFFLATGHMPENDSVLQGWVTARLRAQA